MTLELDFKERSLLMVALLSRIQQLEDLIETFQTSTVTTKDDMLKMWGEDLVKTKELLSKLVPK